MALKQPRKSMGLHLHLHGNGNENWGSGTSCHQVLRVGRFPPYQTCSTQTRGKLCQIWPSPDIKALERKHFNRLQSLLISPREIFLSEFRLFDSESHGTRFMNDSLSLPHPDTRHRSLRTIRYTGAPIHKWFSTSLPLDRHRPNFNLGCGEGKLGKAWQPRWSLQIRRYARNMRENRHCDWCCV